MNEIGGWWWQDFKELDSTNDTAQTLAMNPPAPKFMVSAQKQTNGRGRRGRNWASLPGNLFVSLALPWDITCLSPLVFMVSLSVWQTIRRINPQIDVKLKWPNDVLIKDRKISGILLEKATNDYIIIGIGINIVAAPQQLPGIIYRAVSLKEAGVDTDRVTFLRLFSDCLNQNMELWTAQGFAPIRDLWLQNVKGLNQQIVVNLENESKTGLFVGIDEAGRLLLDNGTKIEKISAGDVFYL